MFFVFLEKFHSFYIFLCFKKKICLLQTSFGLVPRNTIYYIIIIVIISIINNIKIDCQKLRNTDSCLCKEFQSFLSLTLPCKKYEELTLVYSLRYFWNNFFFFKRVTYLPCYRCHPQLMLLQVRHNFVFVVDVNNIPHKKSI